MLLLLCRKLLPWPSLHPWNENASVFFPISTFQSNKTFLHHFRAINKVTAFHMFWVFFGWRCPLPLALYSCLFFFCNLFSKLICSIFSFSAKTFPDSTNELFLSHHFPRPSANSLHCQFVSVFLLLPLENCCRISGIHWSCVIPHLPEPLRTPPARNWDFFFRYIDRNERSSFAEHWSHERTQLLHFFLIRARCFSFVILRLFGFYPNYFSFRTLNLFTFLSWHATLTSDFGLSLVHGCLHH